MKSYKKILLTAAASLIIGTQAFAAEKLRIGTEGAYPPFNLIDASGQAVGFDLDIAHALCAKMKVECEVVTSDWDGIIPALNAGKFDFLAASMSVTEERKQAVDFTDHYYTNKLQFVAPKSVDFKTDKDYLDGKVIGAQRATIAGTWLEDNMGGVVEIKLYDTQENAYLDLASGRVDGILADTFVQWEWLKRSMARDGRGASVQASSPSLHGRQNGRRGGPIDLAAAATKMRQCTGPASLPGHIGKSLTVVAAR